MQGIPNVYIFYCFKIAQNYIKIVMMPYDKTIFMI